MSVTIPFPATSPQRIAHVSAVSHERIEPQSHGVFECLLTTVAPLCLKKHFEHVRLELPGNPPRAYLPGSSIRGAVRAMTEALGGGCARYFDSPPFPPNAVRTCDENGICPCCRIFGFTTDHDTFAWASKVHFEDSDVALVVWRKYRVPPFGGDQAAAGQGGGWLTFRHLPAPAGGAPGEDCVDAGAVFPFRVRHHNLTPAEMALFYHALTLGGLHHILGFGKRCGLGACKIEVKIPPSPVPNPTPHLCAQAWTAIQQARA